MVEEKEKQDLKKRKQEEETMLEMSKFYFLNGKYDAAISELEKVVKLNPRNSEAYYNLGLVYEAKGMNEQAQEMYKRCLKIDPKCKLALEHLNKLVGI